MKIYIANRCYDYEGSAVIGVFSSKKLAQKSIDKDKKKEYCNDGWKIEEFELDKEMKTKKHKLQITKIRDKYGNIVFDICSCGRLRKVKSKKLDIKDKI